MDTEALTQPNLENLNCRVRLTEDEQDGCVSQVFSVEICGTIYAPAACDSVIAEISVTDTTDGVNKFKPVYTFIDNGQIDYSHIFCHTTSLGRLPSEVTALSRWMVIAKIPVHLVAIPFAGRRNLQFTASILAGGGNTELAYAVCGIVYANYSQGYIEIEEGIRRARIAAVKLAFVVAATEKEVSARAVTIIQNWAKNSVAVSGASILLNGLLAHIVVFLPGCARIYSRRLCRKIATAAPMKVRCDILELCLRVAGAGGIIAFEQLILLKNIANWFEISRERFRSMLENILPLRMHEIGDMEISLGIAEDMDNDQICQQLSKEYRKWNARVINRNPEVENQAEHMLKLIADIRDECSE
jgi:hypothetical protein